MSNHIAQMQWLLQAVNIVGTNEMQPWEALSLYYWIQILGLFADKSSTLFGKCALLRNFCKNLNGMLVILFTQSVCPCKMTSIFNGLRWNFPIRLWMTQGRCYRNIFGVEEKFLHNIGHTIFSIFWWIFGMKNRKIIINGLLESNQQWLLKPFIRIETPSIR